MRGYRPDDDWAELTTQSGESLQSGHAFLFFGAVVALPIVVGLIGHFTIGRTVSLLIAVSLLSAGAVVVQELRACARRGYFEFPLYRIRVSKEKSPWTFSWYFVLYSGGAAIALAIGITCAALVYFNPAAL